MDTASASSSGTGTGTGTTAYSGAGVPDVAGGETSSVSGMSEQLVDAPSSGHAPAPPAVEAIPPFVRPEKASRQRNLTLVQPLRGWLAFCGFSASGKPYVRVYQLFITLMLLAMPLSLFWLLDVPESKFTSSTLAGFGIVALAPLLTFAEMSRYMRDRCIEVDVLVCQYLNGESGKTVRMTTLGYTVVAVMSSLGFVVYFAVNLLLAFEKTNDETRTKALTAVAIVSSVWSFSVFLTSLAIFGLLCGIHRLQCTLFVARFRDPHTSLQSAVFLHDAMRGSVRTTCKRMSHWLFSSAVIITFSIVYQLYGFYRTDRDATQYNGMYYIVVFFLVLVLVLWSGTSVTSRMHTIKHTVADMYPYMFVNRVSVSHFVEYLAHSDTSFRVFGVELLPEMSSVVVFAILGVAGALIRAATL